MAHVTTAAIITAIKDGTYPTEIAKIIRFTEGKQAFPIYPYVEVIETAPRSESEEPELTTTEQTFEIKYYTRYARTLDRETPIIEKVEAEILAQLDLETFEHGELFYEDRKWGRESLRGEDPGLYGSISTLRLTFRDITASETGTILGAGTTLAVGGTTLTIIRGSVGSHGRNYSQAFNDVGDRFPITGAQVNSRTFEYKYKRADYDAIEVLIDAGNYVSATLTEGSNVTTFTNVLPISQRDTMDYAGLKVVLLEIQIQK